MLEAVVVCIAIVPTLPVPLLKCLTFHPSPLHLMTGCVCVCGRTRSGHRVCMCKFMCVCAVVYQGMNKSQRAWICFPWHGFRLNTRALNPDIRLSFSPKPQWAEKSTKHGNTNTQRHLPFLSHYLLFSLTLCSFVEKSSRGPPGPGERLLPRPLSFSLCSVNEGKREERER